MHVLIHWFLHFSGTDNETGRWYAFWSGFGSDLGELAVVGGLVTMVRHHNCGRRGCLRLAHELDADGRLACHRHHSKYQNDGA